MRMISKTFYMFQCVEKAPYITSTHLFIYLFIHLFMKIEQPSIKQNIIIIQNVLTVYILATAGTPFEYR